MLNCKKTLLACKGKRLAFDLDKTLTVGEVDGWADMTMNELADALYTLEPNKEMIDFVNELAQDNTIYIFTARSDFRQELTYKWLKRHGVNFKYLQHNKNHYDWIIDDKAINALDLNEEIR